jgi:[calcium/calmodulin-dependent protein kinase] kinase
MKKVYHENIVKLFEVIENSKNDKMYLVLEYMNGPSLLSLNSDIETIWKMFRDFMLGLEYCIY